jgi:hypothetical protein
MEDSTIQSPKVSHPFLCDGDSVGFFAETSRATLPKPPFMRLFMEKQWSSPSTSGMTQQEGDFKSLITGLAQNEAAQVEWIYLRLLNEIIGFHDGNLDLTGRHEKVLCSANYSEPHD